MQNISTAIMARRVEPHDSLDHFPTQPFAVRAFVERVMVPLDLYNQGDTVWEPACAEGHMVRVLREYYQTVHGSDVFDYGAGFKEFDFLNLEEGQFRADPPFGEVDWIITNPPFGPAKNPRFIRFTEVALSLARRGVVMFGRIQMLEAGGRFNRIWRPWERHALFAQHVERVPLAKGRLLEKMGSASAYGWLVIVKDREFPPVLPGHDVVAIPTVFIPKCRAEMTRAGDYETEGAKP